MRRTRSAHRRGFTLVELVIAAGLFSAVVGIGLVWLLAQGRATTALGSQLAAWSRRPPLETLLRQDVQAATQVLPSWQGITTSDDALVLAMPKDEGGFRAADSAIVVYARAEDRLLRAAFPSLTADAAAGQPRWVGPGGTTRFACLDAQGQPLQGTAVARARLVDVTLPGTPGRQLRLRLRNVPS